MSTKKSLHTVFSLGVTEGVCELQKHKDLINALLHCVTYIGRLTWISIFKYKGIMENSSYERRIYGSVDDGKPCEVIYKKINLK